MDRKQPFAIFTVFLALCVLGGCATTTSNTRSPSSIQTRYPNRNQPEMVQTQRPITGNFLNNLPLGIGGRLDLFVSETAEQASEFYEEHIEPRRNGTLFRAKPYNIDYSILPSSGDLYRLDNELHDKTVKSDYDLRVGMTRRYTEIGDFFKTDFWLARGKYGPAGKGSSTPEQLQNMARSHNSLLDVNLFGQPQEPVLSADPGPAPQFDVKTLIEEMD